MKNLIKASVFIFLSFAFVGLVSAQNIGNLKNQLKNERQGAREKILNIKQEGKNEIKDIREQARKQIRTLWNNASSSTSMPSSTVLGIRQEVKNRREQLKNTIEAKRTELKSRVEEERNKLKERLQVIKDKKKRTMVERIDNSLVKLNEKMTNQFLAVLEKLENVLERIKGRTNSAESKGLNVSSVRTVISDAEKAISTSRESIKNQVAKIYTITISTSTVGTSKAQGLKGDVGEARQLLHGDLVKVRDTVQAARDAVHEAAVALAQIHGIGNISTSVTTTTSPITPTSTSTSTPTSTTP